MRCPDCNKFVSFGEPECESNDCSVSDTSIEGSVTVNLNCADCGTTLKSAEISFQHDIDHTCAKPPVPEGEEQFELEDDLEPTGTDRFQTTDRHGKPIRNPRYQRHYYGFEGDVKVKCNGCEEVIDVHLEGEEQASGFEEQT